MGFILRNKWPFITVTVIILLSSIGLFWYKHQLEKAAGGHTEILDPKPFFQSYETIGIKNVNLLYPDASHFVSNQNIVLKDGMIHSIGSSENLDASIHYIDGTDRFLIPGLVDTHVHLRQSKNDLMLYLANGITTVWEMYGRQNHLKWREEKQQGGISPELFVATRKIGSREGLYHWGAEYFGGQVNFTTAEATQKGVRDLKEKGYDALKLGSFINQEIYNSLLNEAKTQQIPVLGHLSQDIGLKKMLGSGLSELAHVEEIIKNMMNDFGGLGYENTAEFIEYVNSNSDSVAIRLRDDNIAVSTTIFLMESLPKQKFDLEDYLKSVEIKYVNPSFLEGTVVSKGWLPGNNGYENPDVNEDPERRMKSELWWNTYVEAIQIMTEALNEHGVVLLEGTDANTTGVVPGFSLHNELQSLVRVGLTNAEAIYSATTAPSKWIDKEAGVINVGYRADLVLLSADPLHDISNSKSIDMVFSGKFYLTKNNRDKLLLALEDTNERSRAMNISGWK